MRHCEAICPKFTAAAAEQVSVYFPILVYTSIEVQQHDLFHRWKHGEAYNSVAIESDQWQSK
jgi:hypothetical protein